MRVRAAIGGAGVLVAWAACGGTQPGVAASPTVDSGPGAEAGSGEAGASETSGTVDEPASATDSSRTRGGSSEPALQRSPVLAAATDPPGLQPLSKQERQELEAKCEAVVRHVQSVAGRDRRRKKAAEYVEQVAANPPTIAGVDVTRCASLLLRDTRVYVAKSIESEAMVTLKMLMVGLADAMARDGKLCPSAPPVPRDLSVLVKAPYQAKPVEWSSAGWRCAGFDLHQAPQRFQYELETNPQTQRFEIVARGFPVAGQSAVELFLPGKVEGGVVELSSEIFRR